MTGTVAAAERAYRTALCLVAVAAAAMFGSALAQDVDRELLNSERIELMFGSYGIEVLASDGAVRVSRLYSTHAGREICRTFAVVLYPDRVDPALADEHALVLSGQSIGATFAGRGWTVLKAHRYLGTIAGSPGLSVLMGSASARDLAVHVYDLSVRKGGQTFDYVTIAEVHHPDYLTLTQLHGVYGQHMALPTPLDDVTRRTLALVSARMP